MGAVDEIDLGKLMDGELAELMRRIADEIELRMMRSAGEIDAR